MVCIESLRDANSIHIWQGEKTLGTPKQVRWCRCHQIAEIACPSLNTSSKKHWSNSNQMVLSKSDLSVAAVRGQIVWIINILTHIPKLSTHIYLSRQIRNGKVFVPKLTRQVSHILNWQWKVKEYRASLLSERLQLILLSDQLRCFGSVTVNLYSVIAGECVWGYCWILQFA